MPQTHFQKRTDQSHRYPTRGPIRSLNLSWKLRAGPQFPRRNRVDWGCLALFAGAQLLKPLFLEAVFFGVSSGPLGVHVIELLDAETKSLDLSSALADQIPSGGVVRSPRLNPVDGSSGFG